MEALSPAEWIVAEEYCKGLADKEVADNLRKSVLTTKTQKRSIYRKLGISKDTELLLYMLCMKLKRDFDLKGLRKHGLELLFSVLFIYREVEVVIHGGDSIGLPLFLLLSTETFFCFILLFATN